MIQSVIFLLGLPAPAVSDVPQGAIPGAPLLLAQLAIEQRVIVRIPMARLPPTKAPAPKTSAAKSSKAAPPPSEWEEKKGPRCLAVRSIRQAAVTPGIGLDVILTNNQRYRLRLEKSCRAVDFYSGFYIEPSNDGSLCAGRDAVQSRAGAECEIEQFRKLVPDR